MTGPARLTEPRPLEPVLQEYTWGSTTAIPRLLGQEPTGRPQAELWFGAHPKAPSLVDGVPLDELISADPSVVGAASLAEFGARLPYLLKILAAAQPLSLQAHPSRSQAELGYAREDAAGIARDAPNRNYRDDWPKPEMFVALEATEALCGFRDPAVSRDLLQSLQVDGLDALIAPLSQPDVAAAIKETFVGFLQLGPGVTLVDEVVAAARAITEADPAAEPELARLAATAVELVEVNPGDPGVLAALLMNRVALGPGQAVFLRAGNMHAYLHGLGVEIMANSDNVLRGGLTPKHVDVGELGRIVDFAPEVPVLIEPVTVADGLSLYPTPEPEFTLWRVSGADVAVGASEAGRIVLAIDPTMVVAGDTELELAPGAAAFVPAGVEVSVTTDGIAFVAAPAVGQLTWVSGGV